MTIDLDSSLGKLTADQKQKCAAWVQARAAPDLICPVCRTNKWEVADHLIQAHVFIQGGAALNVGTPIYPYFQLCCVKCANTLFFNAVDAGIAGPNLKSIDQNVINP
jgi:hypothetical protein